MKRLYLVGPLLFLATLNAFAQSVDLTHPLVLKQADENKDQHFTMESRLTSITPSGTVLGTDVYRLKISYDPQYNVPGKGKGFRCLAFSYSPGDSVTLGIPSLTNWTYVLPDAGTDKSGQVLGIDHARFEQIKDDQGRLIPFDKAYHIYNTFVDFHAICSVFANPAEAGQSVADLHHIGDEIVHHAAFSQPPTHLGSHIAEGSFFKNGRITLNLKGLTEENSGACALIGYDSGRSAFKMIMHPMAEMEVVVNGYSHYWGDIVKSLDNHWVQRATLVEIVASEATLPMPPGKTHSMVERQILIRNVTDTR